MTRSGAEPDERIHPTETTLPELPGWTLRRLPVRGEPRTVRAVVRTDGDLELLVVVQDRSGLGGQSVHAYRLGASGDVVIRRGIATAEGIVATARRGDHGFVTTMPDPTDGGHPSLWWIGPNQERRERIASRILVSGVSFDRGPRGLWVSFLGPEGEVCLAHRHPARGWGVRKISPSCRRGREPQGTKLMALPDGRVMVLDQRMVRASPAQRTGDSRQSGDEPRRWLVCSTVRQDSCGESDLVTPITKYSTPDLLLDPDCRILIFRLLRDYARSSPQRLHILEQGRQGWRHVEEVELPSGPSSPDDDALHVRALTTSSRELLVAAPQWAREGLRLVLLRRGAAGAWASTALPWFGYRDSVMPQCLRTSEIVSWDERIHAFSPENTSDATQILWYSGSWPTAVS